MVATLTCVSVWVHACMRAKHATNSALQLQPPFPLNCLESNKACMPQLNPAQAISDDLFHLSQLASHLDCNVSCLFVSDKA